MPYNSVWPDGTVSVKANEATGKQNTTFVEVELKKDHYFNEDATNDGHHKKVEMPNIADIANDPFALDANGDPTVLSASQECMLYTRKKTATEATATQQDEPFAYTIEDPTGTPVNHIMQLGFRAMVCFEGSALQPTQAKVTYTHNIKLQDVGTAINSGVYRVSKGIYVIKFLVNLPSPNYVVFGSGIRNDSGVSKDLGMYVFGSTSISNVKTSSFVKVMFKSNSGDLYDPLQGFIAICGG